MEDVILQNADDGFVFNKVVTPIGCDKERRAVGGVSTRWERCLRCIVVCGEIIVWFCMRYIYCGILYAMDKNTPL